MTAGVGKTPNHNTYAGELGGTSYICNVEHQFPRQSWLQRAKRVSRLQWASLVAEFPGRPGSPDQTLDSCLGPTRVKSRDRDVSYAPHWHRGSAAPRDVAGFSQPRQAVKRTRSRRDASATETRNTTSESLLTMRCQQIRSSSAFTFGFVHGFHVGLIACVFVLGCTRVVTTYSVGVKKQEGNLTHPPQERIIQDIAGGPEESDP